MELSIYHEGENYEVQISHFEYFPGSGKDYHCWSDPDDKPGYELEYQVFDSEGNEVNIDLSSKIIDLLT